MAPKSEPSPQKPTQDANRKSRKKPTTSALVWVDSEPRRRRLRTDIKRSRTYYQKAQREWESYESVIHPFYEKWRSTAEANFPRQIADAESLLWFNKHTMAGTSDFSDSYGCSLKEAYALFMDCKANPQVYAEIFAQAAALEEEVDRQREAKASQFQHDNDPLQDIMLEEDVEWMRIRMGSKDLQPWELAEFAEDLLGPESEHLAPKEQKQQILKWLKKSTEVIMEQMKRAERLWNQSGGDWQGEDPEEREANTPTQQAALNPQTSSSATAKRKYRALVQALHPDRQQQVSPMPEPERRQLWTLVQQAWASQDEAVLDVILAQINLKEDREDLNQLDLSDLESTLNYYRNNLKSLRQTLTKLKQEDAWQCYKMAPEMRRAQATQIRYWLRKELAELQDIIDEQDKHMRPFKNARARYPVEHLRDIARSKAEKFVAELQAVLDAMQPKADPRNEFPIDPNQGTFDFFW